MAAKNVMAVRPVRSTLRSILMESPTAARLLNHVTRSLAYLNVPFRVIPIGCFLPKRCSKQPKRKCSKICDVSTDTLADELEKSAAQIGLGGGKPKFEKAEQPVIAALGLAKFPHSVRSDNDCYTTLNG